MKVLHIINSLETGGAERLLSALLPELGKIGIEVEACVLAAGMGTFGKGLVGAGVPVRTGRPGSLYVPARIVDLAAAIRESKPDIIHVHLAPALYWTVAALWLTGSRIPLVTTEHNTRTHRMSRAWLRPVERFLYRRCAGVVCVSEASAEAVGIWLGKDASFFSVIPNGIDLAQFRDIEPSSDILEWLGGRKGVAMAARFNEQKDHATLIRALSSLPDEYAVVLAGEGETRAGIERLVASRRLDSRVLFAGTRNDIPGVLAACRTAALSTFWEGMPVSMIEAMAARLPVVASDVPGLSEVVGETGILFPPGDADSCARAILTLSEEGEARNSAIAAGTRRASDFSIRRCAALHGELYRRFAPKTNR